MHVHITVMNYVDLFVFLLIQWWLLYSEVPIICKRYK